MQHFLSDDNRMSNNAKDTHPQIPFSRVRGKKGFPTGAPKFLSQKATRVNLGWFASRGSITMWPRVARYNLPRRGL